MKPAEIVTAAVVDLDVAIRLHGAELTERQVATLRSHIIDLLYTLRDVEDGPTSGHSSEI